MTGDGAGGGPPSVGCDVDPLTPGPQCTLRRALNLTNNVAGEDTITFNIPMTQPNCDAATGRCTINLTEALPDITDGVSINGPGADKLTVRGTGDSGAGVGSGIFVVQTTGTVTLSGMTVSKGLNNASDGGGGIRNNGGTVNVTNSTLTDNIASGSGGGIFNFGGGTVNITKSTLMNNRGGSGGHIYNGRGTLNVTDSTLSGASASLGGGIFNAIQLLGPGPFMVVNGDTFTDIDFGAVQARAANHAGALAWIVLVPNPTQHPQGDFGLEGEQVVERQAGRFTYSGVGVYRPEFFEGCTGGKFPMLPLLKRAIAAGRLRGQLHEGEWCDVGTPQRLAELDERVRARVR